VDVAHDLIVSLDGPPAIHDRIRRVSGAFALLSDGVDAVRSLQPTLPIAARTTVQRENFRFLNETARTAKALGLQSISFLATDLSSTAFNRPSGWTSDRQSEIALTAADISCLEIEIQALLSEWAGSGFLMETAEKLQRIVLHYRAHLGLAQPVSPPCNAPWVSAVVEAEGTIRPCFFHRPIGHLNGGGLLKVLNGPEAVLFRTNLNTETNPTCQRCVCSLNWRPTE
jgi:sulfatase maturation enzyme AslB (radical SAM superfamily)